MADSDLGKSQGESPSVGEWPPRRVVLLGASNLVRGLPIVVDSARKAWSSPLDIIGAFGHGRSYGMESCVLGRSLPGILQCGLWDALSGRPPAPTAALLTDIGNDILYGATAAQIARWVESCLLRLRPVSEQIAVTQLPMASIEALGPTRFRVMRSILFPRSRLQLEDALQTARKLNEEVTRLARRYDACLVEARSDWFGFDPIHIKRAWQPEAWQVIFSGWCCNQLPAKAQRSFFQSWTLRGVRPQTRKLFGVKQHRCQPSRKLEDGTLVSLY